MEYYGLIGIDLIHYIDTQDLYGKGLKTCCEERSYYSYRDEGRL